MKYIIMCGGNYTTWEQPRQLMKIRGEPIVARTIRLLRECGVNDIAISSNYNTFKQFHVPLMYHHNNFTTNMTDCTGNWVNAFYSTSVPVCYLFGDVVFSPEAIRIIVETQTDDIEFFASSPPFAPEYIKKWAEPFAFKVVDTEHFGGAIATTKYRKNEFKREPIAWELWQVIKDTPLNEIDYGNYVAINDYTCDIDSPADIELMEGVLNEIYGPYIP